VDVLVYVRDLIRMKVNANVMGVKHLVVVAEHVELEINIVNNNVVAKINMDMDRMKKMKTSIW
jgi:hypothetical protein